MKERPIIFSGEMVRAILDGRKTMTRRVVKQQPTEEYGLVFQGVALGNFGTVADQEIVCPYGELGDRLWVKETVCIAPKDFAPPDESCKPDFDGDMRYHSYKADGHSEDAMRDYGLKWTPSIFMPRWASRITLEITEVRVERLQEISEEDADSEGILEDDRCIVGVNCNGGSHREEIGSRYFLPNGDEPYEYAADAFAALWDSINGKSPGKTWDDNPWVWVISFRRMVSNENTRS